MGLLSGFCAVVAASSLLASAQAILRDPRLVHPSNITLPPYANGSTVLMSDFGLPPDCGEGSYVGNGRLAGRRALITGGDSGIGRAVAIAYAREGADVTINYLPDEQSDADDVRAVVEGTTDSRFFTIPGDLRNANFCEELVDEAVAQMGGLDILINNAGWTDTTAPNITSLSDEVFRRTMETNIFAPFYLTRAAVPHMPPGSSIIFTASNIVDRPSGNTAHYAATKAFAITYSLGLAEGLMTQNGIRVNAVKPGVLYSPFLPTQGQTTAGVNRVTGSGMVPMGRLAQPVEASHLYVSLAENAQTHVYGAAWEL